jgi:hypothetical protein
MKHTHPVQHITDKDVWLRDEVRRDFKKEVKERIEDRGLGVEAIEWWTFLNEKGHDTGRPQEQRLHRSGQHSSESKGEPGWLPMCSRLD